MSDSHEYGRKLTATERKEIAEAFGWKQVEEFDGGSHLLGDRPLFDSGGLFYGWCCDKAVPEYNYDTLRFVRESCARLKKIEAYWEILKDAIEYDVNSGCPILEPPSILKAFNGMNQILKEK